MSDRKFGLLIRGATVVVALGFTAGVLAFASGVLPNRRPKVIPEIRFYLERGASVTDEEIERATRLVEETRASLTRYRDVEAAKEDGYFNSTPGAVGVNHWMNLGYMRDGRILDPERPENLMYYRTRSGKEVLVGAMYLMQAPGETGPAIGGEMTRWHLHPGYCWAPAGFPVSPSATEGEPCPPGQMVADTPDMIHVWVMENPRGVFDEEMDLPEPPG